MPLTSVRNSSIVKLIESAMAPGDVLGHGGLHGEVAVREIAHFVQQPEDRLLVALVFLLALEGAHPRVVEEHLAEQQQRREREQGEEDREPHRHIAISRCPCSIRRAWSYPRATLPPRWSPRAPPASRRRAGPCAAGRRQGPHRRRLRASRARWRPRDCLPRAARSGRAARRRLGRDRFALRGRPRRRGRAARPTPGRSPARTRAPRRSWRSAGSAGRADSRTRHRAGSHPGRRRAGRARRAACCLARRWPNPSRRRSAAADCRAAARRWDRRGPSAT